MKIVIIDIGIGNVGSVANMFKKLGINVIISDQENEITQATHLLMPGVGSFDHGIKKLKNLPTFTLINHRVKQDKIPTLGICLGMQLFTDSSEEGSLKGLGWIKGETKKFSFNSHYKACSKIVRVPHMGWNTVDYASNSPLLTGYNGHAKFYFVHSYHVCCLDKGNVVGTTNYGIKFESVIQNQNIIGVQFHPEKSHKYGLKLFENFTKLTAQTFL